MRRTHDGLGRRRFLQTLGSSAAMLPFLPVMNGEAGGAGFPRRIVLFYYPIGTVLENWRCTGGENDFVLSPILAPLERHRDRLLVLDGIDNEIALSPDNPSNLTGHPSLVGWWTGVSPLPGDFQTCFGTFGWAGGPSVDQSIADAFYGETPLRSLDIGVMLEQNDYALAYSRQSYRGANEPITPMEDPAEIFQYMFGDLHLDPAEAARIRDGRQSVIDLVAGDLIALEGGLVGEERAKLQAHLDNLRAIEMRIQNQVGVSCMIPPMPASQYCPYNATSDCNATVMPVLFDLMTSALACDLTRVVAFQAATESSGPRFAHHDRIPHEISHSTDTSGMAMQTEITTFWMDALAQLLDRLRAIPEGDGTLLDNTLVVCASCIGESWYHGSRNCPVVLAGNSGGYLRPGRYLRFGSYDPAVPSFEPHGGRTNNDLLISMCHAVGLTDVETFGNPAYCTGPIGELT
jgi:hypothetical protein